MIIKFWKERVGIDRVVFLTLMSRAWTVLGGLGSLYFITRNLTQEMQGYYYTFGSIITLQIFVELGVTTAIIHFSSHEMASLAWTSDGTVTGCPKAKKRLQSVLYFAISWFVIGAVFLIIVLIPVGIYFFRRTHASLNIPILDITEPWTMLVCATALNLVATAFVAIIEGCGKVREVATLRLYRSMISVATMWIVLSNGGQLYAISASSLVMALVSLGMILDRQRRFLIDLLLHKSSFKGISWYQEIWPFQWRIAVSWASAFLSFNLLNPLIFAYHGPILAGRLGMSLQIVSAINNAALSWIDAKVPILGSLIVRKKFKELNDIFFGTLFQSSILLIVAIVITLIGVMYLEISVSVYAERILSFYNMVFLGIACIFNHFFFSEAAYLRSFKEEPLMKIAVINGFITATLSVLLIPKFGTDGAIFAYLLSSVLISFGCGTYIFINKLKNMKIAQ